MSAQDVIPALLALLYWRPYRARAKTLGAGGRPVARWRQACFAAGLLVLVLALSSPVGRLSERLLLAHMVEHLLIGDVAALLLVLGLSGPLIAPLLRIRVIGRLRGLAHPAVAGPLWLIDFYVWHLPALYQAALRHPLVHAVQHGCFLLFGMAMWMALLGPLPKPAWFRSAARLLYIVGVRLAGAVLGNVLLWSQTVFYPYYRGAHGIGAQQDQSLAGSLMMVEGSFLTLGLFCWLFLLTARQSEERQELLDFAAAQGVALEPERAERAVAAGRAGELRQRLVPGGQSALENPGPTEVGAVPRAGHHSQQA
ncbi:MAG: cytochrome c oxidase assembly protein [Solirubrobacteraceae bacterium]